MTRFYSILFITIFSFSGLAFAETSKVTSDAEIIGVLNIANKAEIKAAEKQNQELVMPRSNSSLSK